jgi:hypothetical protein
LEGSAVIGECKRECPAGWIEFEEPDEGCVDHGWHCCGPPALAGCPTSRMSAGQSCPSGCDTQCRAQCTGTNPDGTSLVIEETSAGLKCMKTCLQSSRLTAPDLPCLCGSRKIEEEGYICCPSYRSGGTAFVTSGLMSSWTGMSGSLSNTCQECHNRYTSAASCEKKSNYQDNGDPCNCYYDAQSCTADACHFGCHAYNNMRMDTSTFVGGMHSEGFAFCSRSN